MNADFTIVPMLKAHEAAVNAWRYEGQYAFYNEEGGDEPPSEEASGVAFAALDARGDVAGFFEFGKNARVDSEEGYVYSEDRTDIGLGLRPDMCGKGLGGRFLEICMDTAAEKLGAKDFRLTVAAFNERAIKVYERAGFVREREITSCGDKVKFIVMTLSGY